METKEDLEMKKSISNLKVSFPQLFAGTFVTGFAIIFTIYEIMLYNSWYVRHEVTTNYEANLLLASGFFICGMAFIYGIYLCKGSVKKC